MMDTGSLRGDTAEPAMGDDSKNPSLKTIAIERAQVVERLALLREAHRGASADVEAFGAALASAWAALTPQQQRSATQQNSLLSRLALRVEKVWQPEGQTALAARSDSAQAAVAIIQGYEGLGERGERRSAEKN